MQKIQRSPRKLKKTSLTSTILDCAPSIEHIDHQEHQEQLQDSTVSSTSEPEHDVIECVGFEQDRREGVPVRYQDEKEDEKEQQHILERLFWNTIQTFIDLVWPTISLAFDEFFTAVNSTTSSDNSQDSDSSYVEDDESEYTDEEPTPIPTSNEIERILVQLEPANIKAAKMFVRMEGHSHESFLAFHGLQDNVTVEELKNALAKYSEDGEYVGEGVVDEKEECVEFKRVSVDDPKYEKYEWVEDSEGEDEDEDEEWEDELKLKLAKMLLKVLDNQVPHNWSNMN